MVECIGTGAGGDGYGWGRNQSQHKSLSPGLICGVMDKEVMPIILPLTKDSREGH